MNKLNPIIEQAYKVLENQEITKEEAISLSQLPAYDLMDLFSLAGKVKNKFGSDNRKICTIINAKSGKCSEDCKFCAQSAKHNIDINTYGLESVQKLVDAAQNAKNIGSSRFGIVTSGLGVKPNTEEFKKIIEAVKRIVNEVGIEVCTSLGVLKEETAALLKEAGVTMYHHNIETAPSFYSKICTTHSFEDRLKTIKALKKSEINVCSGGIIGMGETIEQRIEMAFTLKEIDVYSIPINILQPIEGTPIYKEKNAIKLSIAEILVTIALFRLINPKKIIKIAAGRETALKDFMGLAFLAGANGMLQGGYLTIKGRKLEDDKNFICELNEFNPK